MAVSQSELMSFSSRLSTSLTRERAYALAISLAFLIPLAIPGVGDDYPFLFTVGIVLMAWFVLKWNSLKKITTKGRYWEIALAVLVIIADYTQNFFSHSFIGIIDMTVLFVAVTVGVYGIKSLRHLWVPAGYLLILMSGYYLEDILPQLQSLQNWLASVMGSFMQGLGVQNQVVGDIVYLNQGSNLIALQVEGVCTGIQGILAFGMLSSMAVLDIKVKISRAIPLFIAGFVGAFLINIVRLFGVFLTFEYLGVAAGTTMHVYLGYTLFIVWVLVFWSLAFKYLPARPLTSPQLSAIGASKNFPS
jgi:exosortase